MMNKNIWWWIIGIIVVVLIVLYSVGAFTGAAIFARPINAHSCSADDRCEANNVLVSGEIDSSVMKSGAGIFANLIANRLSIVVGNNVYENAIEILNNGNERSIYVDHNNSRSAIEVNARNETALETTGVVIFNNLEAAYNNTGELSYKFLCIDQYNQVIKKNSSCDNL